MRVYFILSLIILTSAVFGQPCDSALLVLSDNSHDFGRISVDKGVVSHTFIFTNAGNKPLQVTNVRTTCGCTIPFWTSEQVAPGSEGSIKVEFDPTNNIGAFHKTIQILSTASNTNMFVTISGTVIPAIKKEELKFKIGDLSAKTNYLNFGYLFKGNTGIELLTIANTTPVPLQIGFKNVPDYIRILAIPATLQPGEYGQLEVQYCTERTNDWDVILDKIALVINGKTDSKSMLTVTANIREDFSKFTDEQLFSSPVASYSSLTHNFDTIKADAPVECRFLLKNEGQSELIIRAVKPSCGCTAVKPEKNVLAPGDSTYLDAVLHPEGRAGDLKSGITVVTNDPKLYKQYLWLEGYIRK
jgi:hypothetical protein